MKAAAFDYARPASVAEALDLMADEGGAVLAGGQSLLTLLALRMTTIERLVDVSRLAELRHVEAADDYVFIGAATTHAAIEDGRIPDPTRGFLPRVASKIAYRAVRNHGTIGGSVALADPAADWPACLLALDAKVAIVGPEGPRTIGIGELVEAAYTTTLAAGELLLGFRIGRLGPGDRWGTAKVARKSGAYAMSLAFVVRRAGRTRIVFGGSTPKALLLPETAARLDGGASSGDGVVPATLVAEIAKLDPDADAYLARCHVANVLTAIRMAEEGQ